MNFRSRKVWFARDPGDGSKLLVCFLDEPKLEPLGPPLWTGARVLFVGSAPILSRFIGKAIHKIRPGEKRAVFLSIDAEKGG